jgi:hypothetical protein
MKPWKSVLFRISASALLTFAVITARATLGTMQSAAQQVTPQAAPAQATPAQDDTNHAWQTVSLSGKSWAAVLDLPGFSVTTNEVRPDGRAYLLASNHATWVTVSATLEQGDSSRQSMNCRAEFEAKLKDTTFKHQDSRIWEEAGKTFMEYTIPDADVGGADVAHIQQRNLFVCALHEGVYVDLHLSKVKFVPADEALFTPVVDSLTFKDIAKDDSTRATAQRPSLDYWMAGSAAFAHQDFQRAIPAYAQALALEKQNRALSKTYWYVLVDNLGMAYGITGQLEKAREVFQYGISQEPNYPLFYYNMACYYGEKRDAQNAGVYLKKAFERKANLIAGETMPDPRSDDSFQELLKQPDFHKLVDSILNEN